MSRLKMMAAGIAIMSASVAALADDVPSPNVVQEIREIQQQLGGSAVKEFSELWGPKAAPAERAPAVWSSDLDAKSPRVRPQIEALRTAATQLDATANRLEGLELYSQADGLRQQAQQLRIDARRMMNRPSAGVQPSISPSKQIQPLQPIPAPSAESEQLTPTPLQE